MFVTHLESALDGTQLPANQLQTLHNGRPLWVRYNLDAVGRWFEKDKLRDREPTMGRYRELLPLPNGVRPVALGEGVTAILECQRLGEELGLRVGGSKPSVPKRQVENGRFGAPATAPVSRPWLA